MSNYFSTLIYEPVVRQARRFSTAPDDSRSLETAPPLSHARVRTSSSETTAHLNNIAGRANDRRGSESVANFARRFLFGSRPTTNSSTASPTVDGSLAAAGANPRLPNEQRQFVPTPPSSPPSSSARPSSQNEIPQSSSHVHNRLRSMDNLITPDSASENTGSRRSMAQPIPRSSGNLQQGQFHSGSLPADDGMRLLRKKIHEIRDMNASNEDKARMMHYLMTERHYASQAHLLRPTSAASSKFTHDTPLTPSSANSTLLEQEAHPTSPLSLTSSYDPDNPYNLRPGDTDRSYYPKQPREERLQDSSEASDDDEPVLGCQHYRRNVKVQCFDCKRWYTCRHCHDEVEDHNLNRRETRNMICMLCAMPQPAAEHCSNCGQQAAWYYCPICKLWDNDSTKRIYHCDACGICRIGEGLGKDFVHCKKCNVCITIQFASSHRCIERATECDCPICGDFMFTSSASVVAMPCGHYLHRGCYDQYMQTAYKCPICKKSAVNMELQWRKLQHAIETQPMPPEFANTRVVVHCNDCGGKSETSYHWVGNRCGICGSFNGTEVQFLGFPEHEGVEPTADRNIERREAMLEAAGRVQADPRERQRPSLDTHSAASTSYFLSPDDPSSARAGPISVASATEAVGRFSPYAVIERFSRSLSPIRQYLGGPDETLLDSEEWDDNVGFWGTDGGRILSGDEEDDEDDEDEDEEDGEDEDDSSEEEDSMEEEDDDDDEDEGDGEGGLDGIESIIGHR